MLFSDVPLNFYGISIEFIEAEAHGGQSERAAQDLKETKCIGMRSPKRQRRQLRPQLPQQPSASSHLKAYYIFTYTYYQAYCQYIHTIYKYV